MVGVCLYHSGLTDDVFWRVDAVVLGLAGAGARDCVTGRSCSCRGFVQPLHSNIKRGLRTFAIAMALSAGSLLVAPPRYLVRRAALLRCLHAPVGPFGRRGAPRRRAPLVPLLLLFFAVLRFIASGRSAALLGTIALRMRFIKANTLFWLGFPRSDLSALIIGRCCRGLLFAGAACLAALAQIRVPDWLSNRAFAPLRFRRHTLSVYLIHQPVFICLLWLWFIFPDCAVYLR